MDLTRGYRPDSPLARLPAAVKLTVLALAATVAIALDRDRVTVAVTVTAAICLLLARLPASAALRTLRTILPFVAVIVALEGLTGNLHAGARHGLRLIDLVMLALVVTATSSFHELFDVVTALLRPLRRFGLSPETVALAAGMTIRFIPLLVTITDQTRAAFRARGVRPRMHELLFPVLRRALLMAAEIGMALAARESGQTQRPSSAQR